VDLENVGIQSGSEAGYFFSTTQMLRKTTGLP
jgi:hypothetical protein